MKYIIAILALGFIGCGDNSTGGTDAAGNALHLTKDGQPIYTLESRYSFRLNAQDFFIWSMDKSVGDVTNSLAYNRTTDVDCSLRMVLHSTDNENSYTMKIGASDQTGAGCGQLRGNWTITLTGPTTADIEWINDLENGETF